MRKHIENKIIEYGKVLESTNDFNIRIYIIYKLDELLSKGYVLNENLSDSTFLHMDVFISNIIESINSKQYYITFIYIKRYLYHHRSIPKDLHWYELGDLSQFFKEVDQNP